MVSEASYLNNELGDSPFFGFWVKVHLHLTSWWASTSLHLTTFKGLLITVLKQFENDQLMQLCTTYIVQDEGFLFLFDRSF